MFKPKTKERKKFEKVYQVALGITLIIAPYYEYKYEREIHNIFYRWALRVYRADHYLIYRRWTDMLCRLAYGLELAYFITQARTSLRDILGSE